MIDARKVRVMVLDDSLLFRELMTKGLGGDSYIEVVGFAGDPFEAKDKIPELERAIFNSYIEGFSYEEMGRIFELNRKKVDNIVQKVKRIIKSSL